MSTAVTRMDQDTKKLYVAFELGEKEWKLAMSADLEARSRLRSFYAGNDARVHARGRSSRGLSLLA